MSNDPVPLAAHRWARDPHDWYVDEPWCSARLFEEERFEGGVIDPACGLGRILDAAEAAGLDAWGTDICDRGHRRQRFVEDFLRPSWARAFPVENIVSNPPFKIAEPSPDGRRGFVEVALERARRKVAMILPLGWLTGDDRSRWLERSGLRRVWVMTPRPSMPPGAMIQAGVKPCNGTKDFAWFVWLKGYDGAAEVRWLRRDDGKAGGLA